MLDGNSQRRKVIAGVIEDLAGHSVVLRRGGSTVEVFKLREIESIQFGKSASFDEGLRQMQNHEWLPAIATLKIAETTEPREWVVREIQASLAEALRAAGSLRNAWKSLKGFTKTIPTHGISICCRWSGTTPAAGASRQCQTGRSEITFAAQTARRRIGLAAGPGA